MNPSPHDADQTDPNRAQKQGPVFEYQTAGLREHKGFIPFWLWLVVVVMVCWGIYYLVANWRPPM